MPRIARKGDAAIRARLGTMLNSDGPVDPVVSAATSTLTTQHGDVVDVTAWSYDAGRYELGAEIARGGGGRVLAATDQRLGRSVAVKLPLDDTGSMPRLLREAQLIARLEHPSIVPVHDLVRGEDGTPFYVMKLLDGETLRTRLADKSFEERIAYLPTIVSIADAIAYAHHRGIVHRDLKPANVIVGSFGETFVIDWGLARVVGGGDADADAAAPATAVVTVDGAVVGTPAYMTPEQARGERVDARTDVYGLGALIYHVLCGEPPFTGASSTEVIAKLLDAPPPGVAAREPRVPIDLAAIVTKAMARSPDERYPTARELAADLRHYQAGRLVAAHRYSTAQRVRRWLRRNRTPVAVATAIAAAATAIAFAWPSGIDPRVQCAASGTAVANRWPLNARAAVTDRVRAFGGPSAAAASTTIAARLEAYVQGLVQARVAACEATHVHAEQSAELLDRRGVCLTQREHDLRAAIEVLSTVSATELDGAVHAASELPSIAPCAEPVLLRDTTPIADDPVAAGRAQALYSQLTTSRTLRDLGRPAAALDVARAASASVGPLPYSPYVAETHLAIGAALQELGRTDEALSELHLALTSAEIARDDVRRADALTRLAQWAVEHAEPDEARRRLAELSAIAIRVDDLEYETSRLEGEADLAARLGDSPQSIALSRRALEIEERRHDAEGIAVSAANVALGLISTGRAPCTRCRSATVSSWQSIAAHYRWR
jgi:tetratricopeptide (TPR) repeat protein